MYHHLFSYLCPTFMYPLLLLYSKFAFTKDIIFFLDIEECSESSITISPEAFSFYFSSLYSNILLPTHFTVSFVHDTYNCLNLFVFSIKSTVALNIRYFFSLFISPPPNKTFTDNVFSFKSANRCCNILL